jgi:hypothetical protein
MSCHFDISLPAAPWFDARGKTRLKNGNFDNTCTRYWRIAAEEMQK